MLLALGTAITLMPESVLAPLAVRLPTSGAAASGTTALALMIGLGILFGAGPARAARDINTEQKWIEENMLCPCNCRHLLGGCGAECAWTPEYKKKVHDLLVAGKS